LIVDGDSKSLCVAGDTEQILKLFERIDKYMLKIAVDESFLDFSGYRENIVANKPLESNQDNDEN